MRMAPSIPSAVLLPLTNTSTIHTTTRSRNTTTTAATSAYNDYDYDYECCYCMLLCTSRILHDYGGQYSSSLILLQYWCVTTLHRHALHVMVLGKRKTHTHQHR